VPIHLVRHAHAGKRSQWASDDRLRPLSERGEREAEWLVGRLAGTPVRRIVSSPFVRCVQTVEPLAAALGLEVEATDALAEHADPEAALELLLSLDQDQGVACSHGDLIPVLLRRLEADGMAVDGPLLDQKGSVWLLETKKGKVRRGRYVPPGS
jgi:phosphohistidine phosphatase SixA